MDNNEGERMKRKILLLTVLLSCLAIPISLGYDVVPTSTGFLWENVTFDNRTLIDWDFYIYNSSNCPSCTARNYFIIRNYEGKSFYLAFQIIPSPTDSCFTNNQNCPASSYDTMIGLEYTLDGYYGIFKRYGTRKGNISTDVTSCWNWWNTTDEDLRKIRQSYCPTAIIKVDKREEKVIIDMHRSSPTALGFPDYTVRLLGFSQNRENIDNKISPPILGFMTALTGFMDVSVDIWKVGYYVFAILMIMIGLGLVIGVFPLGLRWVVKKVLSD